MITKLFYLCFAEKFLKTDYDRCFFHSFGLTSAMIQSCEWGITIQFSNFFLSHRELWLGYCLTMAHVSLSSCL